MSFTFAICRHFLLAADVLSIAFYVALAVVCSIYQRWLSVIFSVACAFVFFLLLSLKYSTVFAELVFARFRTANTTSVGDLEDNAPPESLRSRRPSPACKHLRADLCAPEEYLIPVNTGQSEEEGALSSIVESSTIITTTFGSDSVLPSLQVDSVRTTANPFRTSWQSPSGIRVMHNGRVNNGSDLIGASLQEKSGLSPLLSLEHMSRKDPATLVSQLSCAEIHSPPGHSTELESHQNKTRLSREFVICGPKDHLQNTLLLTARNPNSVRASKGVQCAHGGNSGLPASLRESSLFLPAASRMPFFLYMIVLLVILTLGSSLVFRYETHCLFLVCPVLSVPWLWANLVLISRVLYMTPEMKHGFHHRLLHVLTHWLSVWLICVASLGVFVAAFTADILRTAAYGARDDVTPTVIRVVSYLAPIVMMITVGGVFLNFAVTRDINVHDSRGEAVPACEMPGTSAGTGRSAAQQMVTSFTPALLSPLPDGQLSTFGPPSIFLRASTPGDTGAVHVTAFHGRSLSRTATPSSIQTTSDDTCSTLSSIVRSSLGSSAFIPCTGSSSSSRLSLSKGVRRNSTLIRRDSVGHRNSAQAGTTMTAVPQLKTLTMLYVAFRDIYDDDAEYATPGVFRKSDQEVGVTSIRDKQQTVSVNFEALMESLEDANAQGNAEVNAYILTAYEDAICLIWGLIPFTSEPVLLALEKARQIMDSFKSRPKPPTNSRSAQQELVAAVVSAPHSLVGYIGTGFCRGLHFFNSSQHALGAQMLRCGLAMHRRLPSLQASVSGPGDSFQCILLDGRSWNSTAGHLLARPCGICQVGGPEANLRGRRSVARHLSVKPATRQFQIFYNFLGVVEAKEEEWHLVVQRQEQLGSKFRFLSEAVQLLHQGDTRGARDVLLRAVESTISSTDADNITLAHMLLEDLDDALGEDEQAV